MIDPTTIKSEPLDDYPQSFATTSCVQIETVHGFEIKCEVEDEQVVESTTGLPIQPKLEPVDIPYNVQEACELFANFVKTPSTLQETSKYIYVPKPVGTRIMRVQPDKTLENSKRLPYEIQPGQVTRRTISKVPATNLKAIQDALINAKKSVISTRIGERPEKPAVVVTQLPNVQQELPVTVKVEKLAWNEAESETAQVKSGATVLTERVESETINEMKRGKSGANEENKRLKSGINKDLKQVEGEKTKEIKQVENRTIKEMERGECGTSQLEHVQVQIEPNTDNFVVKVENEVIFDPEEELEQQNDEIEKQNGGNDGRSLENLKKLDRSVKEESLEDEDELIIAEIVDSDENEQNCENLSFTSVEHVKNETVTSKTIQISSKTDPKNIQLPKTIQISLKSLKDPKKFTPFSQLPSSTPLVIKTAQSLQSAAHLQMKQGPRPLPYRRGPYVSRKPAAKVPFTPRPERPPKLTTIPVKLPSIIQNETETTAIFRANIKIKDEPVDSFEDDYFEVRKTEKRKPYIKEEDYFQVMDTVKYKEPINEELFQYNVVKSFRSDLKTRRNVLHTVVSGTQSKSSAEIAELARQELMRIQMEKEVEKEKYRGSLKVAKPVPETHKPLPMDPNARKPQVTFVKKPERLPVLLIDHQCPVCLIKFKTNSQLMAHERVHGEPKSKAPLNTADMTKNVYDEVKMKIEQIGNKRSIHAMLPNFDYAFVVTNSTATKLYMKCFRQTCDVKAYSTNDGRFFMKKGEQHNHGSDRSVILTKIREAKMDVLEKSNEINKQVYEAIVGKQREKEMAQLRKEMLIEKIKRQQEAAAEANARNGTKKMRME